MAPPTSVRFDDSVSARLGSFVARHPGLTRSSVAARYVDEGLRMDEHPGVLFREGPTGRRATVVGGPDVWEIIRDLLAVRAAEPDVGDEDLLTLLETNAGVPAHMVRTAVAYWSTYPAEVEALLTSAGHDDAAAVVAAERVRTLLPP